MPDESIRVIVNGAQGRMGKQAVAAINDTSDLTLVAAIGRQDDLAATIKREQAEVVVDLTQPYCVYENCKTIIEHRCSPVVGTSGLTEEQITDLTARCSEVQLGGVIAPNFSLGAVLMMQCAKLIGRYLADVEIIEAHHPQKLDAPSGTAVKTAQMISRENPEINSRVNAVTVAKTDTSPARGENHFGIPVHSMRLPGIVAAQTVYFGGQGETLTLQHQSLDRASFMPGLLLACQQAPKLDRLHYGLEHLLGDIT